MKYLYGMRDPDRTLRDISESVMRRVVGNRLGSDVLTTARVEIGELAEREIQEAMKQYDNGIHIVTVQLQDVVPPRAVQPAFNEVNEARQERERMINEATKRLNQEIPKASGEANRLIAEAEGYAAERVNQALGETAAFRSILTEYRSAPAVTRARKLCLIVGDPRAVTQAVHRGDAARRYTGLAERVLAALRARLGETEFVADG